MDHQYAALNALLTCDPGTPVYLVQDLTLTRVLTTGHHVLECDTGFEGRHLGLFPVGQPATVITRGLKWDIDGELAFGGLVSAVVF